MSKKQDIYNNAENELTTGSAFFPGYLRAKGASDDPPPHERTVDPPTERALEELPSSKPASPPGSRSPGIPLVKRVMVRHSFEVYLDQVESLRAYAEAQRRRGDHGSMSMVVRKSIDGFLESNPLEDN